MTKRESICANRPTKRGTKIFPKVLRYKWEAYCDTNGSSTEVFPSPGNCDSISQNAHPSSTFVEFSQCQHCQERLPGPRKGFWVISGSLSPKTAASIYTLFGCCQRTTARKTPAISTRKCSCQELANPCPTLGQLLASRILYALWVGSHSTKSAGQDFVHRIAQKLVNSWSIPRQLPIPCPKDPAILKILRRIISLSPY